VIVVFFQDTGCVKKQIIFQDIDRSVGVFYQKLIDIGSIENLGTHGSAQFNQVFANCFCELLGKYGRRKKSKAKGVDIGEDDRRWFAFCCGRTKVGETGVT
jgi:hypothetical protein